MTLTKTYLCYVIFFQNYIRISELHYIQNYTYTDALFTQCIKLYATTQYNLASSAVVAISIYACTAMIEVSFREKPFAALNLIQENWY